MSTVCMTREDLVKLVTRLVVERLQSGPSIPIGISNRHIHLSRADMDILFGKGSELTWKQDLKQPGQYACQETVIVRGPKGEFKKVRVLGPLRPETQLEISKTDSFQLGVSTPIRESGDLKGTPGIEIIGPAGSVKKDHGVIVALRHIHMSTADAKLFGVKDKDVVNVVVGNDTRRATLTNVLVRVSDKYALEMHIDIDEGNAVGAQNNDPAYISKY